MPSTPSRGSVALVTLGCTRNEVDSEELAGRLSAEGWTLVDDAADADVALVNTCGFVEQAKKDSIDTLLEAADLKESGRTKAVVAGAGKPVARLMATHYHATHVKPRWARRMTRLSTIGRHIFYRE